MTEESTPDYALYAYKTINIGDEIQSLAARQFLPELIKYVDRDQIGLASCSLVRTTKLVMNGWYMHGSDWPPASQNLEPLLISMFVNQRDPAVRAAFSSEASLRFLKRWGPVGARDATTLAFLRSLGVPAYFSGCLTLTLRRDPAVPKQDFVLAIDLSPPALGELRSRTARPVLSLSPLHDPMMCTQDRFVLAEYFLFLIQSAHCVVTTRLHATLPSLGLGTPVLFVSAPGTYDPTRFTGLTDLAWSAAEESFVNGTCAYDFDAPPENPTIYRALSDRLIDTTARFTGVQGMRPLTLSKNATDPSFVELFSRMAASGYENGVLARRLRRVERSTSWRLTRPLRRVGNLLGRATRDPSPAREFHSGGQ